jgi:hypothetical protein
VAATVEGAHRLAEPYLTGNLKVPAESRVPEAVPRGVFRVKTAGMLGQGKATRAWATGKKKQKKVKTFILQTTPFSTHFI